MEQAQLGPATVAPSLADDACIAAPEPLAPSSADEVRQPGNTSGLHRKTGFSAVALQRLPWAWQVASGSPDPGAAGANHKTQRVAAAGTDTVTAAPDLPASQLAAGGTDHVTQLEAATSDLPASQLVAAAGTDHVTQLEAATPDLPASQLAADAGTDHVTKLDAATPDLPVSELVSIAGTDHVTQLEAAAQDLPASQLVALSEASEGVSHECDVPYAAPSPPGQESEPAAEAAPIKTFPEVSDSTAVEALPLPGLDAETAPSLLPPSASVPVDASQSLATAPSACAFGEASSSFNRSSLSYYAPSLPTFHAGPMQASAQHLRVFHKSDCTVEHQCVVCRSCDKCYLITACSPSCRRGPIPTNSRTTARSSRR